MIRNFFVEFSYIIFLSIDCSTGFLCCSGIEVLAGRILVLLSTSKISADDFKDFLQLFKEKKPPLV